MNNSQNDMDWQETTTKMSKTALVDKLIEEIEDAKEDCDANGYALFDLYLRGDKNKIMDFINNVFDDWNRSNEIYEINIESCATQPSYGTTDVWAFNFELSKPDDNDEWNNDCDDDDDTFCELVDESELPSLPKPIRKVMSPEEIKQASQARRQAFENRKAQTEQKTE